MEWWLQKDKEIDPYEALVSTVQKINLNETKLCGECGGTVNRIYKIPLYRQPSYKRYGTSFHGFKIPTICGENDDYYLKPYTVFDQSFVGCSYDCCFEYMKGDHDKYGTAITLLTLMKMGDF